jgi:hypothetical protein
MSIDKIISGGQTGAEKAALDFAIEMDIPHGGWIPKGRSTENGPLDPKYQLQEMPTSSYPKRTEQNVIDSDGTLILTHGKLTGSSLHTEKMAKKHNQPCLHINLRETNAFDAAVKINNWIHGFKIRSLNVAGPRASKDPAIYDRTSEILKAAYFLGTIEARIPGPDKVDHYEPQTVEEAVRFLMAGLSLRDKARIARIEEKDLNLLHKAIGEHIRNKFGLGTGNENLMESCRFFSRRYGIHYEIHEADASAIITREFWKKIKEAYGLKVVKS